jgi:acetyl esterase/lipase
VTRTKVSFSEPELERIEKENEQLLASAPREEPDLEDPAYLRELREDTWWYEPRSEDAVDLEIAARTCRIFDPGDAVGVYVRIHGGGWVFGSYDAEDVYSWRLARETKLVVISVDYRLAPEHPWPTPNEDCERVTREIVENSRERFGVDPVFIGGESSGAQLALVTALRIRNRGLSLAGVNLVAGIFDLGGVPSIVAFKGPDPMGLSGRVADWYARCYVDGNGDLRDPDVSPLWADLNGLPPLLISTGDRAFFLADRVELAGGQARLDVYPRTLHGFEILSTLQSGHYHSRVAEWVSSCVGEAG